MQKSCYILWNLELNHSWVHAGSGEGCGRRGTLGLADVFQGRVMLRFESSVLVTYEHSLCLQWILLLKSVYDIASPTVGRTYQSWSFASFLCFSSCCTASRSFWNWQYSLNLHRAMRTRSFGKNEKHNSSSLPFFCPFIQVAWNVTSLNNEQKATSLNISLLCPTRSSRKGWPYRSLSELGA